MVIELVVFFAGTFEKVYGFPVPPITAR